mmetsp:Transcript_13851/g.29536  ORF Transcript_13851/g.29536 Transcript_13851/m.29536 type:complete len:136 (+) Transcript_13851:799-1206(+)
MGQWNELRFNVLLLSFYQLNQSKLSSISFINNENTTFRLSCLFLALALLLAHQFRVLRHPEFRRCDLQYLITGKIFYTGIQRKLNWGSNSNCNTLGCGTHVGELLCFAHIDGKVTRTLVDSDNHILVGIFSSLNK